MPIVLIYQKMFYYYREIAIFNSKSRIETILAKYLKGVKLMNFQFDLIEDKIEFFEAVDLKTLEQKINKQIEINKKDLDHTILTKDSIIAKLEEDLEKKINQIEELNNNINELYSQMSNVKSFPIPRENESDILKRIKELMDLKGFVTDKELEQIL